MEKKRNNFREIVSGENGLLSSKRVMGVVIISICLICTCWLVWSEGGTQVVENLLQTQMIMAAALLGISSVTGIWKKGGTVEIKHREETEKDPCDVCKYKKEEVK